MIKKRYDQVSGLLWIALGIGLSIESIKLGLGTIHNPGSGFAPFLMGGLLGLFGLILTSCATLERLDKSGDIREVSVIKGFNKGFLSLIFLFMYTLLLETLGFIVATSLLLFLLLKILEPKKWVGPIFISLLGVALSYLIFHVWLRISFPRGILNIG